ncbi:hypothetical protein Hanom_Chr16g01415361 [Helianthus anomalus]
MPCFVILHSYTDYRKCVHQEALRSDGSDDKKDWRKTVSKTESGRRWHEEERETGLLGRKDRRKTDRRADTYDNRVPSSDRWFDVGNRNSKWSSRWGPDEKEKDRTEKKTDVEKETRKHMQVERN